MILFTRVYTKLLYKVSSDTDAKKMWFEVEKNWFASAPKVIFRTEAEHEISEFWSRLGQMVLQALVVVFLHVYIGSIHAILIQGAMNVCYSLLLKTVFFFVRIKRNCQF